MAPAARREAVQPHAAFPEVQHSVQRDVACACCRLLLQLWQHQRRHDCQATERQPAGLLLACRMWSKCVSRSPHYNQGILEVGLSSQQQR